MFKLIIIPVLILLAIAFIGMAVRVIFSKKNFFVETSISKNKNLAKEGITCAKHDELKSCGKSGGCCGEKTTL